VQLAFARQDCETIFGFVDEEARSVHTVLGSFLADWSTLEHRGSAQLVLYAGDASAVTRQVPGHAGWVRPTST